MSDDTDSDTELEENYYTFLNLPKDVSIFQYQGCCFIIYVD